MILPYKVLATLIVLASTFGGGWYLGHSGKEVQTVMVDHEVQVKGDTQIVYKDRVVTVTKVVKPDGTVTETTKTEEKSKDEHQVSTEKEKNQETKPVLAPTLPLARYSFGLAWARPLDNLVTEGKPKWDEFGVDAGTRLLSSPFWIEAGYNNRHEVSLGVRVEW